MKKMMTMMPQTLLWLILAISPAQAQNPPCEFSYASLNVGGQTFNYTTPAMAQPYQGPCMAFAYTSMLETLYKLENNNPGFNPNINPSYLDYKMWTNVSLQSIMIDGGFVTPDGNCGGWPRGCSSESAKDDQGGCHMRGEVLPYINNGDCFSIDGDGNWGGQDPFSIWTVSGFSSSGYNFYGVNQVSEGLTFASTDALKWSIINYGPMVIQVKNSPHANNVGKFRNYSTTVDNYHGYAIMGWKTVNGQTQWLLKDSWPGAAGFVYSNPDPGIVNLINAGSVWAVQASGVTRNGVAGTTWPSFNTSTSNCLPPLVVRLNGWDYGADKGACFTVSGAGNYTKAWSVTYGSTGLSERGNCVEILNGGFGGRLTVIITDEHGRIAMDSVNYTSSGGGGF